nr:transmembrane protein 181 [Hymenolepis microstoma]
MAYQRDLETTVRMQLYTLKKSHVFIYLTLFSTIMIPAVLISAFGPPILCRSTHYATDNLPHGRTLLNGFYKITSNPVLLLQKEIWFSAIFHRENSNRLISIPLTVNISVLCRTYPEKVKAGDESKLDVGDIIAIEKYQKNVTLICMEGKPCNEILLMHIGQLKCAVYTFKVRFLGLLAIKDDSDVSNALESRTVHPRTVRSGRKSRKMIAPSVGADEVSNKYYYGAADDKDVNVGNSIEDTDLDLLGSQIVDDEYSNLNKFEKKHINEDDNDVKISVEDENADAKFGPVMEEENKETNNPVIPNFAIQEIEFIIQTRNPTFSYYEMVSRAVSFIAAFYLFFVFIASLNTFPWEHWTVEQKWTSTILFLLLLYYDPLHPLMYLLPGWIPGALDSFFAISFYTYLLFYWISIFDALRAVSSASC